MIFVKKSLRIAVVRLVLTVQMCLLSVFSGLFNNVHAQTSIEDAVNSMSGLSNGALTSIQSGDPSQSVPKYTTQNASEALYGSGDLLPTDPGNTKISGCQVNPADPNLYTRQDCESVNFVMKNRSIRPNITLSTKDPIVAGNRTITNDPRETLEKYKWIVPVNSDGSIGSLPGGTCSPTTVTTPPMYAEKVCTFYKGSENFLCKAPLVVTVAPHFNYQCLDTLGSNSTESCQKTYYESCVTHCVPISQIVSFQNSMTATMNVRGINRTFNVTSDDTQRITWIDTTTSSSGSCATGVVFNVTINDMSQIEYIKPVVISPGGTNYHRKLGAGTNNVTRAFVLGNDEKSLFTQGVNEIEAFCTGGSNAEFKLEIKGLAVGSAGTSGSASCSSTCTETFDNKCLTLEQRSTP